MLSFRVVLILVWALLWVLSLALPVVLLGANPENAWRGIIVLLLGGFGIPMLQFSWLGNMTVWGVGVLALLRDAPVAVRGGAALFQIGLAIQALFWDTVADEGGLKSIEGFGSGYYVWLFVMFGSAAALLVFTVVDAKDGKRQARNAKVEPPIH